jgi:hypothetical protein
VTAVRAALLAFVLVASASRAVADAPTLEVIYPPGAERGSANTITVSGKFDPWPPKVWVSAPGANFEAQTNKGKFSVTISSDAPSGPRLVRLFNDDGASESRFFVVGATRETTDTEPNNDFARPQTLGELPVTINGRLEKGGDVDSFAILVRAGQWLDAGVDSHTLMSKLDAVLRLVATNGQQLAWNHDYATLDPRVIWQCTNDQTVVLQIYGFPHPATAAVKLYGSESAIYRLHVSAEREKPPFACSHTHHEGTNILHAPAAVTGVVEADKGDRFAFAAKENELMQFKVTAAASGSPLDAFLRIEDASGKELARNDDAEGSRDPSLEWKASTNDTFNAVVGSVTHRGGPDYRYCLALDPALPNFRASLAANSLIVKPDSTNSLKFNVKRLRGHTNELVASLKELPEGVTALSTNVQSGDISLSVVTATNAPAFSGPIRLVLADTMTKEERVVSFPLTSRGEDNGVPQGYSDLVIDTLEHVWLTVRPAPADKEKEKKEEKK